MRRSDVYPSKYLAASDIPDEGLTLTIHHVEEETMRDGKTVPIAYFEELEKGMVINVTKWKVIEALHGEESDDWTGCRIIVYPSETTYEGEVKPCINVRNKHPKPTVAPAKESKRGKPAKTAEAMKAAGVTATREPGDDDDDIIPSGNDGPAY